VLWGKKTNSKHMEHTYPKCREDMYEMDIHQGVSSGDKVLRCRGKTCKGEWLKILHI